MTSRRRTLVAAVLAAAAWSTAAVADTTVSGAHDAAQAAPVSAAQQATGDRRVLLISVDGLNPRAITRLGAAGTPAFHRLLDEGASTLNARSEVEQTETLPNHIGMVTGRRIDAGHHGHGVTWNDERLKPRTVQQAAGHRVASIFSLAKAHGLSSALFAAKDKFSLMTRSWPTALDRTVIDSNNGRLARKARRDLATGTHQVTMLHLSLPDLAGHEDGFMSPAYLQAVADADRLLGRVMATVRAGTGWSGRTWVVLTADHGGGGRHRWHGDPRLLVDYRIPFVVWGPGVASGADLYDLSPRLRDPGRKRPGYAGPQPVRNGFAANVLAELLRLPPVNGSRLDRNYAVNWN